VNRKRLYRCRVDRQIAGVAGGIAEYLDVDPTLVRILWIVSIFFGGVSILLYILMAFIVPLEPVGYGFAPGSPGTAGPGNPGTGTGGAESGEMGAGGGETVATAAGAPGVMSADAHASQWAYHAAAPDGPSHRHDGGSGGGWLLTTFGVLLVVFGAIALLGPMVPGWVGGIHLGPAFVLALGIALLAASLRRAAPER